MDDGMDSRRTPGLEDEADGLDCFASECVVIDTADEASSLRTQPTARAPWSKRTRRWPLFGRRRARYCPTMVQGVLPGVRIVVPEVWRRSAYWPGAHVTTVAVVLFLVGLVGLWMTARGTRPVTRVAEVPRTQAEPARPIAQPVPEPSVARAVEPPRTAAPAATARTKAAVGTRRRHGVHLLRSKHPRRRRRLLRKPSHGPLFHHRRLRPLSSWRRRRW